MTPEELRERCRKFADAIVEFCVPLLEQRKTFDMADQLMRAGTAVEANYTSAQNGRSNAEFRSRLAVAFDEAEESYGWLRKFRNPKLNVPQDAQFQWLLSESMQLTKILAKSLKTATKNHREREQLKKLNKKPRIRRNE